MKKASLRSMWGAFAVGAVAFALGAAPLVVNAAPRAGGQAAQEPPSVGSLTTMLDGFKWGQSTQDVITAHNAVGGVFDKDFDPLLAHTQPGVQQKALEADRDNRKLALQHSLIEFKDVPTGYDATPLRPEYSYRNREALLYVERAGKKRYFFFLGGRLWKIYDEIPLDETGPLGKTFQEAITRLQAQLQIAGRVRAADPSKGLTTTTVDWQDASTHLRALDRGRVVAVVLEERNTLNNLERLRANKQEDPLAMDPSITAITKGGISDPNSTKAAGSASASPGRRGGPPSR